jgi:uncharacterized membrane protein
MAEHTSSFHAPRAHLHGAFGADAFGHGAESFARWFGTPGFLLGQTAVVAFWIAVNVLAMAWRWDPYPFILLNLAFSLQAAYAAPLILLAQTRQADRDRALSDADAEHREAIARASMEQVERLERLLVANTSLTEEVQRLTEDVHTRLLDDPGSR